MRAAMRSLCLPLALPPQAAAAEGIRDRVDRAYGAGLAGVSGVHVGEHDERQPYPDVAITYGALTASPGGSLDDALWTGAETALSAALVRDGTPDLPGTALFAGLDRDDRIGGALSLTHDFGSADVAPGPLRQL